MRKNTGLAGLTFLISGGGCLVVNTYLMQPVGGLMGNDVSAFPPIFGLGGAGLMIWGTYLLLCPRFTRFSDTPGTAEIGIRFLHAYPCFFPIRFDTVVIEKVRSQIRRHGFHYRIRFRGDRMNQLQRAFSTIAFISDRSEAEELWGRINELLIKPNQSPQTRTTSGPV